jgi:hypothetical protein
MLLCLGNRGVGAAMRAEAMTAGVEGRLEDRLQDLEHGLLNHPIHYVGDAKPPLPASGLRQPDPANVAGPIASRQQTMTQSGDERRGLLLRASTVCPSTPGAPWLRITLSSAWARLATDATSSSSRLVSAVPATVRAVLLRLAVCSRKARPPDASGVPASPLPCGLSAKAKLS